MGGDEDWEEEFIAGCHMWTNHKTGEVSVVCPWTAVDDQGQEVEEEQEVLEKINLQ